MAASFPEQMSEPPKHSRWRTHAAFQPGALRQAVVAPPRSADTDSDAESELVAAAQPADEAAFEALAARYSPHLQRVLFRVTQDPELAQDALQDALIRAWKNIGRFQGRSSFFTWLNVIAHKDAYLTARGEEIRTTLPLDDAVGERIPGWGNQADEVFETREFLAAMDTALGRLSGDDRAGVVLRDVEGLTTAETAQVLGIEERALKSRPHRGRMALRQELDAFFTEH